ncbi:putative amino acid permease YvbW [Collibacillus ludicampi]|uniref:Amino acid permease YvbW n=2 Tax=Collibacillus ludicampi TaxID=2771369 RepID=A0AAV4LFZ5_9BACL|nr:putative amino acid permease YvbW [Collibacillus ludicampi]
MRINLFNEIGVEKANRKVSFVIMNHGKQELARQLKSRHIMMIALGGAIGAGIFKGSSSSISLAGPGVIFAYIWGGLLLLFVMQGLAEMAVQNPQARTFRELIEPILGRFTGYTLGWIYWLNWVLVMSAETAASAVFLQYWFADVPLWVLSLIVSIAITFLNLFQVNIFGETEYWLAGIKVTVLSLFIILGGVLLFEGLGDHPAVGFSHLTSHGGFFPHGFTGLATSMLVVMFSFGGTEMIGMTLGETENPEKVIPRASRGVIYRVLLFYVLPILVIVSLVPWDQVSAAGSPFVTVFQAIGIPYVGGLMNFVMLTAVLSATNTGMYAASRMLYTQALDRQAPRFFGVLSKRKVPVRALLASTSFLYVGVIVAFFAKGHTFDYLMIIPGYTVMATWIVLLLAHLFSHKKGMKVKGYTFKGFPVITAFALFFMLLIFAGVILTSPLFGTLFFFLALLIIIVSYRLQQRASFMRVKRL